MSMPSSGADWRLNKDPAEIKIVPLKIVNLTQQNLTFHMNAISKILLQQRVFRLRLSSTVVKSRRSIPDFTDMKACRIA
jgi:hypothetical protein